jgi:NDP-sugar pyrophosphorylase family protein
MKTEVDYYFKKREFPFKEIFEVENVLQIFEKAKEILDRFKESNIKGDVGKNVHIEGIVIVEEGAKILDGTYIVGPVYIGKNSRVGPNAYIRPYTLVGENCQIGGREIKGSILMDNVEVNHHGYIGDSILGYKAHFGAGVTTANLRFDGKNVVDERRKLGAVVGDNVQVGVNSTLLPGTFIGNGSWVYPGAVVKGFVPANSIVKWKPSYEVVEKK